MRILFGLIALSFLVVAASAATGGRTAKSNCPTHLGALHGSTNLKVHDRSELARAGKTSHSGRDEDLDGSGDHFSGSRTGDDGHDGADAEGYFR